MMAAPDPASPARAGGDMLSAVQWLRDALRNDESDVTLDIAALELASIEFPGLDFEASLFRLDHLAEQLQSQLRPRASGIDSSGR